MSPASADAIPDTLRGDRFHEPVTTSFAVFPDPAGASTGKTISSLNIAPGPTVRHRNCHKTGERPLASCVGSVRQFDNFGHRIRKSTSPKIDDFTIVRRQHSIRRVDPSTVDIGAEPQPVSFEREPGIRCRAARRVLPQAYKSTGKHTRVIGIQLQYVSTRD